MTKAEQCQFVRELVRSIEQELTRKIAEGRVPPDWDGIELRLLLADKFQQSTTHILGQRKRAYFNAFLLDPNL